MQEREKKPPNAQLLPSEALSKSRPKIRLSLAPASTEQEVRFGFRVGELGLLVPSGTHSELVEPSSRIYPLPNMPIWLRGLINLRGDLVPVFDLHNLLHLSSPARAQPHLLVLGTGATSLGLLVDDLPQTLDLGEALQPPPPLPGQLGEYCRAVYGEGEMLWIDLDFDRFFRMLAKTQD